MTSYKLTYFDVRALGEPVRYMLSYLGKEFVDFRIRGEQWEHIKGTTPFGKVPVLEIDGKVYHESTAICRYLAIEGGLTGNNALENIEIDQIVGAFCDLRYDIGKMFNTKDELLQASEKKKLVDETIPFYMERFEKVLQNNGGYLANSKISWADLYVVAYCETIHGIFGFDLADRYPHFKKLKETVQALPGIKKWIARRPITML